VACTARPMRRPGSHPATFVRDGPILQLPHETHLKVAGKLHIIDCLTLSRVCRTWRQVAEDKRIWSTFIVHHLKPVLEAFFDGEIPPPEKGLTWKQHFFGFRMSWKRLAQEKTGRMLIQIGAQNMSGRGANETVSLLSLWDEIWSTAKPQTYGVFDVTDFVDHHPGSYVILIDAAAAADATSSFEMAAHSDAALRRLNGLVVPGLEAISYDYELEDLRRRAQSWRWLVDFAVVTVMLVQASCVALVTVIGFHSSSSQHESQFVSQCCVRVASGVCVTSVICATIWSWRYTVWTGYIRSLTGNWKRR